MAYAQHAGLANPSCQLYMLFYYFGPALAGFTLRCRGRKYDFGEKGGGRGGSKRTMASSTANNYCYYGATATATTGDNEKDTVGNSSCSVEYKDIRALCNDDIIVDEEDVEDDERLWPSRPLIIEASAIALFDIFAQSMVYTGTRVLYYCFFFHQYPVEYLNLFSNQ
jgi:hypothetical protein